MPVRILFNYLMAIIGHGNKLGNKEQERHHRQQQEQSLWASPAAIQDQRQDVLPYPTDWTFQSQPVSTSEDDQTTTLTQETILYHGRSSYRRQQACTPSSWEFPRDAFILGLKLFKIWKLIEKKVGNRQKTWHIMYAFIIAQICACSARASMVQNTKCEY